MLCQIGKARSLAGQPAAWRVRCGRALATTAEQYRHRIRVMALPERQEGYTGPYRLGLTGSIGMGKSTIAAMFTDLKVPVLDADAAVHALYARGGGAVEVVERLFPDAVVEGAVDRKRLSAHVLGAGNEANLAQLEAAIHPLVAEQRENFLNESQEAGHTVVVYDVPLLFEKDLQSTVDATVVVSAPAEVQRRRVLAREGMTAEKFESILGKQVPDLEKCRRADVVLDTSKDTNFTRIEVSELVMRLHTQFSTER